MKDKQTRRKFCRTCLLLTVAGAGTAALFGRTGSVLKNSGTRRGEEEEMPEMIASCGLICTGCPAFIATRENDDGLRRKTAEEWSKMFHADIKPADINCDGCLSNSKRLFAHCFECEIRKCCRERKVANCAECPEFACKKISDFMAMVPEARAKLEELRKIRS